jgi:uncharacterized protein
MKKCLSFLALVLVVLGALNWGLWGFFQFDLVAWLFHGNTNALSRLVYSIIGLAGVWALSFFCKCKAICGCCSSSEKGPSDKSAGGGCCKM